MKPVLITKGTVKVTPQHAPAGAPVCATRAWCVPRSHVLTWHCLVPATSTRSSHCMALVTSATSASTACFARARSSLCGQRQTPGYVASGQGHTQRVCILVLTWRVAVQTWFNIFVLHQNRVSGRGVKNYIDETFIPDFMVRAQPLPPPPGADRPYVAHTAMCSTGSCHLGA